MRIQQIAFFCAMIAVSASAQVQRGAPAATEGRFREDFRILAEEYLDCLDGLIVVGTLADPVFYPQELKCHSVSRKVRRTAAGDMESKVANDLLALHSQIRACRIQYSPSDAADVSRCGDAMRARRNQAIADGGLRAPGAPGE